MGLTSTLRACLVGLACWGAGLAFATDVLILSSERSPSYGDASQATVAELVRLGVRRADIVQLNLPELTRRTWRRSRAPKCGSPWARMLLREHWHAKGARR